jgi:hypothetical protein
MQTAYKAHFTSIGQPMLAATPSTSPHGGSWRGGDTMCIDVQNWAAIPWSDFKAACEEAGFAVDQVTPQELWHITDYHPWDMPEGEDDMSLTPDTKAWLTEQFDEVKRVAAPYKMYTYGTGLILVNPLTGAFSIVDAGYPALLDKLGYATGGSPRINDGELAYATKHVPSHIGLPSLDDAGLDDADVAKIKAAIDLGKVSLSPAQLEKLVNAVKAGARQGGEDGAAEALRSLTLVVKS